MCAVLHRDRVHDGDSLDGGEGDPYGVESRVYHHYVPEVVPVMLAAILLDFASATASGAVCNRQGMAMHTIGESLCPCVLAVETGISRIVTNEWRDVIVPIIIYARRQCR